MTTDDKKKENPNSPFRRRDMCEVIHKRVDEKLDEVQRRVDSIDHKILATLIFAVITLITLLMKLVWG